jgi:hypothetical protein
MENEKPKRGRPRKYPPKVMEKKVENRNEEKEVEEMASEFGLRTDLLFPDAREDERIRINRLDDYTRRPVIHGYFASHEATEARIAELWGGGRYVAIHLRRNEQGLETYYKSLTLQIPGPYKPAREIYGMPRSVDAPAATPEVGTLGGRIPPGMSARDALDSAVISRVLDLLERGKAEGPKIDWPPIVASVTGLLGTIVTAMMSRNRGPDPEMVAMLQRLESQLKAQPGPAASAIGDAVKAVKELIGVRDMLLPESGGAKEFDVMSLIPKLIELVQQRAGVAGAGSGPAPTPLAPPASPVVEAVPVPLWQRLLLHYRAQIVAFARRGMDPTLAGPLALQVVPPDMEGVLIEFVRRPNAASLVLDTLPELQEFERWVAEFVEAIRSEVMEDEEEEGGPQTGGLDEG